MMQFELSDDEPELETLNISNDQYYLPLCDRPVNTAPPEKTHATKLQIPKYGLKTIRHSLPAYDLWKAFFPTYMSEIQFQNFHRPKLRHYKTGPQAKNRWGFYKEYPVKNLSRHIYRNHMRMKNTIIKAINERTSREDIMSKYLLLRHARELSAKDGELYLFEYSEEFPPVLSQVGMASNIRTYTYPAPNTSKNRIRNLPLQDNNLGGDSSPAITRQSIGYDENIKTENQSRTIYYNPMKPGSKVTFIENNLYRAPVFEHTLQSCDFLVIKTRNNYYIRQVQNIFTVGQLYPTAIVPPPNEPCIYKFRCDLSNVYIHKLFNASETDPPSLYIEQLMKLFPDYHRDVIMKRLLKNGAKNVVVKKERVVQQGTSRYGKLSLLELRNILRPETYCLSMSMLAARQRLRELNYTETMIFPEKGQSVELEPEVLAAPWNTSRAVHSLITGRCYLDLERHLIDPTGPAREGFSCVTWVKSPTEEEQAKKMNEPAASQAPRPTNAPIPDRNPLKATITHEKVQRLALYRKASQLLADTQSSVLNNKENLSSSEGESDTELDSENLLESDFRQQVDDLSRLVIGGRTMNELTYEKEEEERRQMLADLRMNGSQNRKQAEPKEKSDDLSLASLKNKILMITRTYESNGSRIKRTEIVREPRIMALYVRKRGGALTNKIADCESQDNDCNGTSQNNTSIMSTKSDGALTPGHSRSRSTSLGPQEICRTDGTKLWISKSVLESIRPMRNQNSRRQSIID